MISFFVVLMFVRYIFIISLSHTGPADFYKKISPFTCIVSFYQTPLRGSSLK